MENKKQMPDFNFSDNDIKAAENMYQKTLKEQTPDMWLSIEQKLPERGIGTIPSEKKGFKKKYIWAIVGGVAACVLCMVVAIGTLSVWHVGNAKTSASISNERTYAYDTSSNAAEGAYDYKDEAASPQMYSLDSGSTTEMAIPEDFEVNVDDADQAVNITSADDSTAQDNVSDGRKLIRTVNMDIETLEFDIFVQTLKDKVTEVGGYFENSSIEDYAYTRSGYQTRMGSFVIRVPEDKLDILLDNVGKAGNVTRSNESVEDVTLQYTDTQTRIDALRTQEEKLLELMGDAESVEDMITIESRLSDVSRELEYYQSLMNQYDNQIDYATLYIDLYEVEKETDTSEPSIGERMKRGLSDTFETIGEGLQNFAVGFVSALPYIVILAIVVVVVVVICRRIYKKHRKMM